MKISFFRPASFCAAALLLPVAAVMTGCGTPPEPQPPPRPVKPAEPVKPKPRPALVLPARAVPAPRSAIFLGRVQGKGLYLVSGERWLVDGRGKVELERAPLGDRIDKVVPLSVGSTVAVGWSQARLYSFTDLLGAPRLLSEVSGTFTHVRPGPGSVLLFSYSAAAALDPSTGAPKAGVLPSFPTVDAVFVDDMRGAAYTEVGGLGVTTDGGRTWKPVRHKAGAHIPSELFTDGKGVIAREPYATLGTWIDLAGAQLGGSFSESIDLFDDKTPIETWLTARGNPLASAVRNGIEAGEGQGVVAGDGYLARVDLGSGAFVETTKVQGVKGECKGTSAGGSGYFVCSMSGKHRTGSQLFRVRSAGTLAMDPIKAATFGGAGAPDILGSPAGGLVVFHGCRDKAGGLCVLQPDGSLSHVESAMVAYPRTVGALRDGRIVSVGTRGSESGDILELVVSTARERKVLAEAPLEKGASAGVTRAEEGEDGVIRFLVRESRKKGAEVHLYAHEPGKKGFHKTPVPDANQASFGDGVLIAQTRQGSRVSHDHGATYRDLDMPRGASAVHTAINRLGTVSSTHTRVGWEPLPPEPVVPRRGSPVFRLEAPTIQRAPTTLACKSSGPGKTGTMLARYNEDVRHVFNLKPAPKGTRRTTSDLVASVTDLSAQLAVEGKEPVVPGGAPTPAAKVEAEKWTFRWVDAREPGARPRSISGKAPLPDIYPYLQGAWAKEGRFFAVVSASGRTHLVRSKGTGFETVAVSSSLAPNRGAPQSFSSDGSIIAYQAGGLIVVWKSGEAPRVVGAVHHRTGGALLGAPTKDGVAVLVDVRGETYHRVFPIPTDKAEGRPEEQMIAASWDGWTRVPTLFGGKGPVAFCDAKPAGAAFRSTSFGPTLTASIGVDGGTARSVRSHRYDVVSDGQSLCLEGLTVELFDRVAIDVKSGGSAKQVTGLDVVRISAKGKKAEITQGGKLDKTQLHSMTCEVAAPAK